MNGESVQTGPSSITIYERRDGSWIPAGPARLTHLRRVSSRLLLFSSRPAAVIYSFAVSKIPPGDERARAWVRAGARMRV